MELQSYLESALKYSPIIVATITAITLLLIYRQLIAFNKNMLSQTYQNIYERMIEIDRFFIENPQLKLYFYYNKELTNEDRNTRAKLHSISEMMIDYFDSVYFQRRCMKKDTFNAKAFYFGDIYNNSPTIRDYLNQPGLKHWYSPHFLDFLKGKSIEVKKYLEELTDEQKEQKQLENKVFLTQYSL